MTVWKFQLRVEDRQIVEMPRGARILSVQSQDGLTPCMWALVNPKAPLEARAFAIFGTGHLVSNEFTADKFIGTVQTMGGSLVWHVFEQ